MTRAARLQSHTMPMLQPPKSTFAMTREQIREMASAVAADLKKIADPKTGEALPATGGGSRQRGLPEELRQRFIQVRTALFQRGIFDPILSRFDTATVPQATTLSVADALAKLTQSL